MTRAELVAFILSQPSSAYAQARAEVQRRIHEALGAGRSS